jgi:UDP:flavonoid glycosyltransferase YjiC (YdhE family)
MSLVFFLDIPIITPIEGGMPNTFQVGSIMGREADMSTIPDELRMFVDDATEGFIIVSFGTWLDKLPTFVLNHLADAFTAMDMKIVWKLRFPLERDLPKHVLTLPWLPQNDLLGHPNAKALVTHCGINSIVEALYHGVPIIGLPLGVDQITNGKLMASRGYGIVLSFSEFGPDELLAALVQVTQKDSNYQSAIKKASAIFKDLPDAGKTASFWISHVIKHGRDHLRSHAFELWWYEYYSLDVMAIWCLLFYVCFKVIKLLCGMLCCRKRKIKQE